MEAKHEERCFVGSIHSTPDITEVDHLPVEFRIRAGDIILVSALIQQQLSELFAHIVGVNPAVFTYLGHELDTSKMITAIKRLVKSDDCPGEADSKLISLLNQCVKGAPGAQRYRPWPDDLCRWDVDAP